MTRKDFKELAALLRKHKQTNPELLDDYCAFCKRMNPAFDRERFIAEVLAPQSCAKERPSVARERKRGGA